MPFPGDRGATSRIGVERATGGAAGEGGVEVGEGVTLDLAMTFLSGAELGDGSHFV